MARQVHLFDRPARFVAGTVGQPGDRTFYLQASGAGRTVSVALEKVQVSLLADRLDELLDEVQRRLGVPVARGARPPTTTTSRSTRRSTRSSGSARWAWPGTATPSWSWWRRRRPATSRPTSRRSSRTSRTARTCCGSGSAPPRPRAFVERARRVISAGRPPCPLCGLPLDAGRARLPAAERLPPGLGGLRHAAAGPAPPVGVGHTGSVSEPTPQPPAGEPIWLDPARALHLLRGGDARRSRAGWSTRATRRSTAR